MNTRILLAALTVVVSLLTPVLRAQQAAKALPFAAANNRVFELDGGEATRQIRATGSKVPIIALAAHAMQGDEQKAKEAGCDDYDVKPIELPRLLGKMESMLVP